MNLNGSFRSRNRWKACCPSVKKNSSLLLASLDEAPDVYAIFDQGSSNKFIIDPHGMISA